MYTPMSVFNTPDCKCFLILRESELQVFFNAPERWKTLQNKWKLWCSHGKCAKSEDCGVVIPGVFFNTPGHKKS